MRRTYERGTKATLSFSGGPHAPVNMADSVEEVNVGRKNKRRKWHVCCAVLRYISYAKFSQILEALREFHRVSRNSPTTSILHTVRYVYRSVWPARETKLRFGTALERSAHDQWNSLIAMKARLPDHNNQSKWLSYPSPCKKQLLEAN